MFRTSLDLLYAKHYERIAQVYNDPQGAFDILAEHRLDSASIDAACCDELKEVLSKTHDFQISDRLNKYGWTTKHISDHMSRFFENKMKAAARLLTLILKEGPSGDFKRALFGHDASGTHHDNADSDSDEDAKYAVIGRHNRDQFASNFEDDLEHS